MTPDVGTVDRYARIAIGLALLALVSSALKLCGVS